MELPILAQLTVFDRVSSASTLLGLLLVLVTLFTSEQARTLEFEEHRPGGAQPGSYRRIALTAGGLALVTFVSLVSLVSLAWDVLRLCCGRSWDSTLAVFLLVWLLLLPLCVWQVSVGRRAWRLWKKGARRSATSLGRFHAWQVSRPTQGPLMLSSSPSSAPSVASGGTAHRRRSPLARRTPTTSASSGTKLATIQGRLR
jgi:hypothetical protein